MIHEIQFWKNCQWKESLGDEKNNRTQFMFITE